MATVTNFTFNGDDAALADNGDVYLYTSTVLLSNSNPVNNNALSGNIDYYGRGGATITLVGEVPIANIQDGQGNNYSISYTTDNTPRAFIIGDSSNNFVATYIVSSGVTYPSTGDTANATVVTYNSVGPTGATGPAGATGATGGTGAAGARAPLAPWAQPAQPVRQGPWAPPVPPARGGAPRASRDRRNVGSARRQQPRRRRRRSENNSSRRTSRKPRSCEFRARCDRAAEIRSGAIREKGISLHPRMPSPTLARKPLV